MKVPVDDPAAMVIDAGTVAAALSDERVAVKPPVGAGPDRVKVAVTVVGPPTVPF